MPLWILPQRRNLTSITNRERFYVEREDGEEDFGKCWMGSGFRDSDNAVGK
jgi:hypothetical protein